MTDSIHAYVIRYNLCNPSRDVGGYRFNCAAKADNKTVWPCTGSEHRLRGVEVLCTCDCHGRSLLSIDREFTV